MRPQQVIASAAGVTQEFYLDRWQSPFNCSLAVYLSPGAVLTYTVEHSLSDTSVNSARVPTSYAASAAWRPTDGMAGIAASGEGNLAYPACAVRLNISSYTSGTATFIAIQGGP